MAACPDDVPWQVITSKGEISPPPRCAEAAQVLEEEGVQFRMNAVESTWKISAGRVPSRNPNSHPI